MSTERLPGCVCQLEIGDSPCDVHDCEGADAPEHVRDWAAFLKTVKVGGAIPVHFRILRSRDDVWILQSTMTVPDRDDGTPTPIRIQNALPGPDSPLDKPEVILARVIGHYQHEAMENVMIDGRRFFDPHHARFYSNLVADWRFNA